MAGAQSRSLTLADVLARAREQAPQIVSARLALEEARGRLLGASLRFQTNPQIDAALGQSQRTGYSIHRLRGGSRPELRARCSTVRSDCRRQRGDRSRLREYRRGHTHGAPRGSLGLLSRVHANERIKLLNATHELAASVYATADRRFKAGDIAVLDVNIARTSLARVRAEREGAEASKALALGELRQLLRLENDVGVEGSLALPGPTDLTAALQTASQRPELRGLEAAIAEAEAELRVGLSFTKPEYGVGVRYSREEGDQIVLGGMTVTLPMFSKGQEQRAVGSARAARLRAELDAARTRVQLEVRAAFDAYNRRLAGVRILEADAIPGLDENEQLTTRSFEVGQLGLPDLLLIRREFLDTRSQYLDALLEAALARIDLDASAGILR